MAATKKPSSSLTPMSDILEPAQPTQVRHPLAATKRTLVQVGIPAILVFVIIVPEIIRIVLDGYGDALPEELRLWLLGAAGLVTATAGVLARVMAIPAVNDWLGSLKLGAAGNN